MQLDEEHRNKLIDLMNWRQMDGAKVIRGLIAEAHRKSKRARK